MSCALFLFTTIFLLFGLEGQFSIICMCSSKDIVFKLVYFELLLGQVTTYGMIQC